VRDIPLEVKKTIAYFFYFVKGSKHHFLRGNEKTDTLSAGLGDGGGVRSADISLLDDQA
jgi:hypothetical protein